MEPTGDQPPPELPPIPPPINPAAVPPPLPPPIPSPIPNPRPLRAIVVETDPGARRRLALQVGVIVTLAVLPDFLNAIAGRLRDAPVAHFSSAGLLTNFGRCLRVVVPALYILLSSGETWNSIGLRRPRIFVDLGLGVLLFICTYVAMIGSQFVGYVIGDQSHSVPHSSAPMGNLALIFAELTANSVAEEFAIWGFLSTRLRRLSANPAVWLVLPALAFASYHLYQNATAVASIFITGLLHGGMFWLSGRLWPSIVSHTLANMVAVLMRM